MSRKTSTYARNRRRTGRVHFNGAEWVNTIQRCAAYGTLREVAGFECNTEDDAIKAEARVLGALESLMRHAPPADVEKLFDTLAHALGVATIRALQILPDTSNNPLLDRITAGSEALRRTITRWTSAGSFGLDAQGRTDLPEAVEVYREILRNSSPEQMTAAANERMKVLTSMAQKFEGNEP